jgi:GGDEF domain-containing protein
MFAMPDDIPNKKAFEQDLTAQMRNGGAVSLIFVDLDGFKQVNDQHGHAEGDICLMESAAAMSAVIDGQGRLYRPGGDEFCIILPNRSGSDAAMDAEQIRLSIEALKKKKIFKPDDIKEEIEDYVFNRDPPYDELDEVGGPHIVMTDISDIEILRQESSGDNVIIDGQGTLELTTDMGDGDSSDDAYPITFSYEFDADGKIVSQLKRHVDTSSFFAGSEDFYGDFVGATGPSQADVFRASLHEIKHRLLHQPDTFLRKLLFVHVITALESYLSDFLISKILKDRATLRRPLLSLRI